MAREPIQFKSICMFCGEEFMGNSPTASVCMKPECKEQYREYHREKNRQNNKHRREETSSYLRELRMIARNEERAKKSSDSISEIVKKATELGMTYGQYVGKYGE